uniref:Zinc finger, RING/FYVE/PHD-type n=1 Tax=Helianthus annuus TaxID=4232 RepID=A0A251U9R4_HELAN
MCFFLHVRIQVVKLRRKELAACMTCPICNKLLRDATTVPECLHTWSCCLSRICSLHPMNL